MGTFSCISIHRPINSRQIYLTETSPSKDHLKTMVDKSLINNKTFQKKKRKEYINVREKMLPSNFQVLLCMSKA